VLLCDTNVFIEIYRGRGAAAEAVLRSAGVQGIAVSDVTRAELFYGARDKAELKAIRANLDPFMAVPVEAEISKLAVAFVERYALSHRLRLPDALIGATAVVHQMDLFTLNTKDFI
jgi:predicted nucleic acid-binding protein